jgi:hypothetical protein
MDMRICILIAEKWRVKWRLHTRRIGRGWSPGGGQGVWDRAGDVPIVCMIHIIPSAVGGLLAQRLPSAAPQRARDQY